MALILLMAQLFGAETAILMSAKLWYDYQNGVKGEQLGTNYSILNLTDGTIVPVKVPDLTPKISQSEITARNQAANFVWVKFTDFVATPYSREGRVQISAKASAITILPVKEVKF